MNNDLNEENIERTLGETIARLEETIARNAKAPRITPEDVKNAVAREQYHVFPETTTTVCCLQLRNGYTVVGESACVFPENFNEEIGRRIAREDAERQIWPLLGYLLKEDMARGLYGAKYQHQVAP